MLAPLSRLLLDLHPALLLLLLLDFLLLILLLTPFVVSGFGRRGRLYGAAGPQPGAGRAATEPRSAQAAGPRGMQQQRRWAALRQLWGSGQLPHPAGPS